MIKIAAAGNPVRKDEAVSGLLLNILNEDLAGLADLELLYLETDYSELLSIKPDDWLILVDGSISIKPGESTITRINSFHTHKDSSLHQEEIISLLKKNNLHNKLWVIGIGIENNDYGIGLSKILKNNLSRLADDIYNYIINLND